MSASLTQNVITRVNPGFQATQKAEKAKFAREALFKGPHHKLRRLLPSAWNGSQICGLLKRYCRRLLIAAILPELFKMLPLNLLEVRKVLKKRQKSATVQ